VSLLRFTHNAGKKARKTGKKRGIENVLRKEKAAKSAQKPEDQIPVFARKITLLFARAF